QLIGVLPKNGAESVDPFQDFQGAVFALGLATMVAGLVVYRLIRFDFALAGVALATVVTVHLFLPAVVSDPSADDHSATLIVSGAVLVLLGLLVDARARRRAAFWWHVLGLGAVGAGLVYFVGSDNDAAAWAAMLA